MIKKNLQKKEMKFRCFITDPNETKWCSRYGRPGYVKSSKNEEDEKYLKEHFKNLEKKKNSILIQWKKIIPIYI